MRRRRMAWLEFEELNPMSVPFIRDREELIENYARRYVEHFEGAETVRDYCYQAGLDVGDKTIAVDLAVRIRRLRKVASSSPEHCRCLQATEQEATNGAALAAGVG